MQLDSVSFDFSIVQLPWYTSLRTSEVAPVLPRGTAAVGRLEYAGFLPHEVFIIDQIRGMMSACIELWEVPGIVRFSSLRECVFAHHAHITRHGFVCLRLVYVLPAR